MAERRPPAYSNLLAFQVTSTADALRRGAAMQMRREHDVSLAQIRVLGFIASLQPVRLRDVAADAGADKAQISRVVASLVQRGYVSRRALAGDARPAFLELTDAGREKYAALLSTLQERDRAIRAGFDGTQADDLVALLARVRNTAEELAIEQERIASAAAQKQRASRGARL
jgi:DNA-binding MarR family transcriptional regulator